MEEGLWAIVKRLGLDLTNCRELGGVKNTPGRHEKSCKPATLVCGRLLIKMWICFDKTTHNSPQSVWIGKLSVEKPHFVDNLKFYRKVHIL